MPFTAFWNTEGGADLEEKIRSSDFLSLRLVVQVKMLSWQLNILVWNLEQRAGLEV